MAKMGLGFVIGLVVAGLLLLGSVLPLRAKAEEEPDLAALLPDFQKIYREALLTPLQEVESEIQDEQIAQFYHGLLEKCGLAQPLKDVEDGVEQTYSGQ